MRLAVIRRRFATTGGAERFIMDMARTLPGAEVELTLIGETLPEQSRSNARFLELAEGKGGRARRYHTFQKAAEEAMRSGRFDVVQTHERLVGATLFRAGDGVHAAWVDRLRRERGPLRSVFNRLDPFHRLLMETETRMAREGETIFVANSRLVAREIGQYLGLAGSRLRIIENGVDLDRFSRPSPVQRQAARDALDLPQGAPVAAFVGSGFERKGAFRLVEAMARRPMREVVVIVCGHDKHASSLVRRAEQLGVADRLVMTREIPDVRQVLHAADVFVLPTLYDPMPNAALEALATGLPIVVTPDAGIAEAVSETGAGAITSRDPEELAEAIAATLARREAASAAAAALAPQFALAETMHRWLDLYREVA